MRRCSLALSVCAAGLIAPAGSLAMEGMQGQHVSIAYLAYQPQDVAVVAGDSVMWRNDSLRSHTVTANDGSFGSGTILGGQTFQQRFGQPGSFPYYCLLHQGMYGRVDVYGALLDAPREAVVPRTPYTLKGRAAAPEGSQVTIEGDASGGFQAITTATVGAGGSFSAVVTPSATVHYRAVAGGRASPPVLVVVQDRRVHAAAARHGTRVVFSVRVSPRSPRGTVVLQLHLPERFGWWPTRRARLDGRSRARFVIHTRRRVRARVLLTLPDGATPLAAGPTLRVRPATS
jgi:plastocyanin